MEDSFSDMLQHILVETWIGFYPPPEKKQLTPTNIFIKVCQMRNSTIEIASLDIRKRDMVMNRQISHYLSRCLTKYSLHTIGDEIGAKDHATVLHSFKTISNLMDVDKRLFNEVMEIKKELVNNETR